MSGGISGDMNLPPQFFVDPQASAGAEEAAAEEAAAEGQEVEGNEGKAGRAGAKKEAGKSEKSSTTTSASGDVIIAGVGGSGSNTGGGGGGGQGQNPSQPGLAPVGQTTDASLEELTSAMVAGIYAMVMAEASFATADYQSGESMLNDIYRNLDSSIDTANSNIMRNKLEEAKTKRIEAEEKAAGLGGAIAGLMGGLGLASGIILQIIGVLLLPIGIGIVFMAAAVVVIAASIVSVGLIASGGMEEGGICGSMATMLGMEDSAVGRMVVLLIFCIVTGNIAFLVLALGPVWAGMEAVEKEQEAAKDCMNVSLARNLATNTPAALKKTLDEMGMENEMAEIMAYLMVLLSLLAMMLGGASGGGAAATGGGTGTATSGTAGAGEGGSMTEGAGEGASMPEGAGEGMDGGFGDFGAESSESTGGPSKKIKSAQPTDAQIQSTIAESKNLAGEFDMQKMLSALKEILESDFDWPDSATNNPQMESITANLDQFAEMSLVGVNLTHLQTEPTLDYIGSLMEADPTKDIGLSVNTSSMG